MTEAPWLTIIGMGEDGPEALCPASQEALQRAEIILAPPRHLSLLSPSHRAEKVEWPVPFADGLSLLDGLRGRAVVVLASGDPFWFGAGSVIAKRYPTAEWHAYPAAATFSLIAAHLGWPLDQTLCLGLHAAPLDRLRPHLANGQRLIVLLRDGVAVANLAQYLCDNGFEASLLTICEAMGGPRQKITEMVANTLPDQNFAHPVAAAINVAGSGPALPVSSGKPDAFFDHDGQITKQLIRAATLSALAPKPFESLWDIGGGSGSIAIEWLLAHPTTQAVAIEPVADRVARIKSNANRLGVDRLSVVEGAAPDALSKLRPPDAVFVGGGLSAALLTFLFEALPPGTRLVANAVTLESEALLQDWSAEHGGGLTRISLEHTVPIGSKRGWKASFPIVQWSVVL
ncbi:MAG: precorrin-6y C5,15-methyltransferase (decarboxylating) subunit CbiE [Roseobacter sp.]